MRTDLQHCAGSVPEEVGRNATTSDSALDDAKYRWFSFPSHVSRDSVQCTSPVEPPSHGGPPLVIRNLQSAHCRRLLMQLLLIKQLAHLPTRPYTILLPALTGIVEESRGPEKGCLLVVSNWAEQDQRRSGVRSRSGSKRVLLQPTSSMCVQLPCKKHSTYHSNEFSSLTGEAISRGTETYKSSVRVCKIACCDARGANAAVMVRRHQMFRYLQRMPCTFIVAHLVQLHTSCP